MQREKRGVVEAKTQKGEWAIGLVNGGCGRMRKATRRMGEWTNEWGMRKNGQATMRMQRECREDGRLGGGAYMEWLVFGRTGMEGSEVKWREEGVKRDVMEEGEEWTQGRDGREVNGPVWRKNNAEMEIVEL